MKLFGCAIVLALSALLGASSASAQDSGSENKRQATSGIGPSTYSTINWGRRSKLTVGPIRLHQHPFVRIY